MSVALDMIEDVEGKFEEDPIDEYLRTTDNPYRITDEEYEELNKAYGGFCVWQAIETSKRLPVKDFVEDIEQDLRTALFLCAQRYKLQKFMVSAIEWIIERPHLIPAHHADKVWVAIFYWQMRAKLGPKHGFKFGIHDAAIAAALRDIDAPIDARYEPLGEVSKYIENQLSNGDTKILSDEEKSEVFLFVRKVEENDFIGIKNLQLRVYPAVTKMSDLPVKPSQHRRFEHDEYFGPYVKRFIMNAANKIKDYTMKKNRVLHGSIDIDEFASVIPDTRPSQRNIGWSNQFNHVMKKVEELNDPDLYATMQYIVKDDDRSVFRGHVNMKQIKRELNFSIDVIRAQISTIKTIISNSGGMECHDSRFDIDGFRFDADMYSPE